MRGDQRLQAGFTLLELLVVLVILGLAASFSGPDLWRAYVKAEERSQVALFSEALTDLRVEAFHTGKSIVLPEIAGSTIVNSRMPELPDHWQIERSGRVRFLPTGVTNGGAFYLKSPASHHWLLTLRPLDGHADIQRQ